MPLTLEILDNIKQDRLLDLKQGFFSSGEGEDGDIGICVNNATFYFSVKHSGQWYFGEISDKVVKTVKQGIDETIEAALVKFFASNFANYIMSNSSTVDIIITNFFTANFATYLTSNSATIKTIMNTQSPRQFYMNFSAPVYENSAGSVIYPNTVGIVGAADSTTLNAILDDDVDGPKAINSHVPVPFRCELKYIYATSLHLTSGSDTDTARVTFIGTTYNADWTTSTGSVSTGSLTPSNTSGSGNLNAWHYTLPSPLGVPGLGYFQVFCTASTNPSTNKFLWINGLLTFNEVL
jgi:hypothetical protein